MRVGRGACDHEVDARLPREIHDSRFKTAFSSRIHHQERSDRPYSSVSNSMSNHSGQDSDSRVVMRKASTS
jgi:hypothetical protein